MIIRNGTPLLPRQSQADFSSDYVMPRLCDAYAGLGGGRETSIGRGAICNNWRRDGKCPFGDRCRFLHGGAEGSKGDAEPPATKDYYKTKLCEKFAALGRCPYDDRCTYAHGEEELRPFRASIDLQVGSETVERETVPASETQSIVSERQRNSQESITYLDKVKAICASLRIGSPYVKPGALQEAMSDIKSLDLLKGNSYADDVSEMIG